MTLATLPRKQWVQLHTLIRPDLRQGAKIAAAQAGLTMEQWIADAIEEKLKRA